MSPQLPDYHFLPAPLWLITVLHVLTLTLHLAAMNFLFGGLLFVVFGRFQDRWNHPVVRSYLSAFPTITAAMITLGIAPLLFVQLVFPHQIYSSSIVGTWFWLMIIVALIIAYYSLYAARFRPGSAGTRTHLLLLALAAMLYVSFVYGSIFSLTERPALARALYATNQAGTALNPHLGSLLIRWLHMLTGAAAVGAFFAGIMSRRDAERALAAKKFFVAAVALAFLSGGIYLFTLTDVLRPLMTSAGIGWLTAAFLLSLGSLHFYFQNHGSVSGTLLILSLACMVALRHSVRLLLLQKDFHPGSVPVAPQWPVFTLFLLCLLAACGALYWMIRTYVRSSPRAEV